MMVGKKRMAEMFKTASDIFDYHNKNQVFPYIWVKSESGEMIIYCRHKKESDFVFKSVQREYMKKEFE